jgi:putative ABC transport system substrate-binding protein
MQAQAVGGRLSRRAFVGGLAGLGVSAGLVVGGCSPGPSQLPTLPRIGYLAASTGYQAGLLTGLRELGYIEGQTIAVESRFVGERGGASFDDLAQELVMLKVRVIVASSTPAVDAAARATDTIPIILAGPGPQDIRSRGLVQSLARPGRNVTATCCGGVLDPKRLELLNKTVPAMTRPAYLVNPDVRRPEEGWLDVLAAARAVGLNPLLLEARTPEQIDPVVESALAAGADGLLVVGDNLFGLQSDYRVVHLAEQHRVPAMYTVESFVRAGGLMAYALDFVDAHRRAATQIDKLLKGTRVAELPLDLPTRYPLLINVPAAQRLGLTLPPELAAQVTEWVQ